MVNQEVIEQGIEKRYQKQDIKKKKQMKVSGKSVFNLKKIITQKHNSKQN